MKIEPTYVTFEQAKWLKEKGFMELTRDKYVDETFIPGDFLYYYNSLDGNGGVDQTSILFAAPEQWQVIEWLRVKHGIWVYVIPIPYSENLIHWRLRYKSSEYNSRACSWEDKNDYMSSQEAYSAAFDYVLTKLI